MVESRFKVGDDAVALFGSDKVTGRFAGGRFVKVEKIFIGPDGKTWIRAWWPAVSTDYEFESNQTLEVNGFKVDYYAWNHGWVEGPEEKFR